MPLSSSEANPGALVNSEDGSVVLLIPVDEDLKAKMKGRVKAFFYAEIRKKKLVLLDEARWREW